MSFGTLRVTSPEVVVRLRRVVAAAVALSLLVTLVPGRLGQLLRLGFQKLVECFLYAAAYKFLELPLDYFFVQLYNLLDMVCRLLSEWCVATSFYQSTANHVSFYILFNLRKLLYIISRCVPEPSVPHPPNEKMEKWRSPGLKSVRAVSGKPPQIGKEPLFKETKSR